MSESEVITMINVKGGVGKTTTTINLAGAMAKLKRNVLILDNDSQSNISQILNVTNQYNIYDLYTNAKITFNDCIARYDNYIYVIPNNINSAILENELYNKKARESILKDKYDKFNDNNFDYILIDNSPFLGITVQNSLVMSDYYIEIIDNSTSALQGLNMVDKVITELKENSLISDLKLLGILRNRFKKRTVFNKQLNEVLEDELKDNLFKTIIFDSVKYKEATALHKTIQDYNIKYSKPFNDLYYELINRIK
ncbi:ParA family protein [Clostridium coskatii]|uniref:Chromosome-partitioning ATPase Soj n=1 Tax=Clostridium coskatii TaxID=1705578 RepID=A0A168NEZ2_9CLOT|nr:ParA family protein [Clostridium coskatii]OAA86339.1 Chromosome-partitioning ATPase Soj [Clostridium coskatii]OAA86357.1 Chromosome-partitioning ATPase Soj [Clostridium coskatii]OBR95076.1 chromosome-partitioning ATPase Soj [Clostridium coskatii]